MPENKVPSKEDFARAKAAARKDDLGLSEVRENILSLYGDKGLHELIVMYSRQNEYFYAYVFFMLDKQVGEAGANGLAENIKSSVVGELESVGRGTRDSIEVIFEFDSHENVEQNFDGDYYSRLR